EMKLYDWLTSMSEEDRLVQMHDALAYNFATQSVFEQLLDDLGTGRPIVIVCHSQGNLIVGNALNALSCVEGVPMPFIHVFCLASPALYWPGGFSSQFYTHMDDLVPLGSFGLNVFRDKNWKRESGTNPHFMV